MGIEGQAIERGQPGGFITKQSIPGQRLIRVLTGISNTTSVPLGADGSSTDTGAINSNLTVTSDSRLVQFDGIFALAWDNAFVDVAGDFNYELSQGNSLSTDQLKIIMGQYMPFTPTTNKSQTSIMIFHNGGSSSHTIYSQGLWKVFLIDDPQ